LDRLLNVDVQPGRGQENMAGFGGLGAVGGRSSGWCVLRCCWSAWWVGKATDDVVDVAAVIGLIGSAGMLDSVIVGVLGVEEHAVHVKRGPL